VALTSIDAKSQVLAMKDFGADLVWHGNTTMSVSATVRDAYALGLGADHIVNNWGLDENLPRLAGKASQGVMGAAVCAFFGNDVPNMNNVVEYAKKYNPGVPLEKRLIRSVQAWANVMALWEAMKRADKAGALNGEGILRKGFESFENYDIGLGVPPLTYKSDDHRISGNVPIYEIKDGKFQVVEVVDLKGRWPGKWEKEWLGW
jgi:branched-chain amino acid transport system substrate-binding protein